ncbi:FcoT family thioesterase [uncultured Corynebacterium sp.]|uniref:FcoT family thioesterase n=1 Tax=uncultured Corynebacterium sp. TaxID=159447 RepID=UPI002636FEA2|nr:FcoT family thioesterase [uncultured Corynebacterium sp.]
MTTTTTTGHAHTAITRTDDDALFHRCLDPYRAKDCIYLKSSSVDVCAELPVDGAGATGPAAIVGRGTFRIGESCYIDDTGHFNAAEFVISYNQLMYMSLCEAVASGRNPIFRGWTIDDYWARQLPDVLIQQLDTRYSRPINARDYRAEFRVTGLDVSRLDRGILKLRTEIEFSDDHGGRARGTVLLALTNTPDEGIASAHAAAGSYAAAGSHAAAGSRDGGDAR